MSIIAVMRFVVVDESTINVERCVRRNSWQGKVLTVAVSISYKLAGHLQNFGFCSWCMQVNLSSQIQDGVIGHQELNAPTAVIVAHTGCWCHHLCNSHTADLGYQQIYQLLQKQDWVCTFQLTLVCPDMHANRRAEQWALNARLVSCIRRRGQSWRPIVAQSSRTCRIGGPNRAVSVSACGCDQLPQNPMVHDDAHSLATSPIVGCCRNHSQYISPEHMAVRSEHFRV